MSTLSASARKLQEGDVERLVKCRLRSEIEARKAVESTMRRAVHEARELKKELVLLRQEKEELRLAVQKNSIPAPGRESARGASRESQASKSNSNKAIELKLRQKIQSLTAQNSELESNATRIHQRVSDLESQDAAAIVQLTADLEGRDHEITSLRDELKKAKLIADETKRKCQKMLKEKKDEAQRALQENEQLARCAKTLQSQLALLPQLKKQLEHAKAKRADVAEVWQNKLEKRDQAFLREEEASKQRLEESAAQIAELADEKENLQARLEELERKICDIDTDHQNELHHTAQRLADLESATHQMQKKLLAAETATREAEQAEVVAKETQEQETRLRQMAEDAADAVEARAEKAERELAQAQTQLSRLEEALTARGVTLDYLLKQQEPISVVSRTPSSDRITARARSRGSVMKAVPTASRDPVRSRNMAKPRMDSNRRKLRSNNDDEK